MRPGIPKARPNPFLGCCRDKTVQKTVQIMNWCCGNMIESIGNSEMFICSKCSRIYSSFEVLGKILKEVRNNGKNNNPDSKLQQSGF